MPFFSQPVPPDEDLPAFWALPAAEVLAKLHTRETGLSEAEAATIRHTVGPNLLKPTSQTSDAGLFLRQFNSPISLLLIGAAVLSFFLRDVTDALIILGIILVSGALGFWQERGASHAMRELLAVVVAKTTVWRDGTAQELPDAQVVPGDVLVLRAGDVVPADCYLLAANELFVNEATLTGETFPVDKQPGQLAVATPIAGRRNALFMGSSVVSGSGTAVVVHTGLRTELGHIAARIATAPPETDFEHGIRRFVLSSTANVFGEPATVPIGEDAAMAPSSPYGESKLMLERALFWAQRQGLHSASLRYFNAAGADPDGRLGEDHRPETHLIPLVIDAALGRRGPLDIFGTDYPTPDGTCVRDYVHVSDLAAAHLGAASLLDGRNVTFNVGTGQGHSVRDVMRSVERVLGRPVPMRELGRRPGDPAVLVASAGLLREQTGWVPRYPDLDTMVAHAAAWRVAHPHGYRLD